MRIDVSNGVIINTKEVNVHDDLFHSLSFNRPERKLSLQLGKFADSQPYNITCFGVLGFEMTNCDFWGASAHIFDFQSIKRDEQILFPKLCRLRPELNVEGLGNLNRENDYLEILMTLSSGDQLRIVCESILIDR